MVVAVVIINVMTMPFILVGLVPLILVFYCLRNYYLKTTREIKRLEATGIVCCAFCCYISVKFVLIG